MIAYWVKCSVILKSMGLLVFAVWTMHDVWYRCKCNKDDKGGSRSIMLLNCSLLLSLDCSCFKVRRLAFNCSSKDVMLGVECYTKSNEE